MTAKVAKEKAAAGGAKGGPKEDGDNAEAAKPDTPASTGELSRRMHADKRLGLHPTEAEPPWTISVQQRIIAILSVSSLVCSLLVLLMAVMGGAACASVYHMNWCFVPAMVMTAASLMLILGTWVARPEHKGRQRLAITNIAHYIQYVALACAVASFILGIMSISCEHWRMSYEPHQVTTNTSGGRVDEHVFCSAMRLDGCGSVDVDYITPWYGWLSHVTVALCSLLYVPFGSAAAVAAGLFVATARREPKQTAVPFRLPHNARRVDRVLRGGRVGAQSDSAETAPSGNVLVVDTSKVADKDDDAGKTAGTKQESAPRPVVPPSDEKNPLLKGSKSGSKTETNVPTNETLPPVESRDNATAKNRAPNLWVSKESKK